MRATPCCWFSAASGPKSVLSHQEDRNADVSINAADDWGSPARDEGPGDLPAPIQGWLVVPIPNRSNVDVPKLAFRALVAHHVPAGEYHLKEGHK